MMQTLNLQQLSQNEWEILDLPGGESARIEHQHCRYAIKLYCDKTLIAHGGFVKDLEEAIQFIREIYE